MDELHAIERSVAEGIYTIMADFRYNNKDIKKFTLIGATTELGELIETRGPFVDRFKIPIKLEDYKISEISVISEQYRMAMFPMDILDQSIYLIIAKNSRKTPRMAIRLTECSVYMKGDIKKVLHNFSIIKDGYTDEDLKALQYIQQNDKGVGLQGLASYLGTSVKNYAINIEPYLLKNNLIIRSPRGRKITLLGIEKIKELEKENI